MHLTEVSRQKERKTQINQLKKALAALGKVKFAFNILFYFVDRKKKFYNWKMKSIKLNWTVCVIQN